MSAEVSARIQIPSVTGSVLDHCLSLIASGFQCVLVYAPTENGCTCRNKECPKPGKHPIGDKWQKNVLVDEQKAHDAFARHKFTPNLGLACGQQPCGEYVISIDVDDETRFAQLEAEHGVLPKDTACSKSGRGYHLLYTVHPDTPFSQLKNITGIGKKPGVDMKAAGGQIVIPPSLHQNGSRYSWMRIGSILALPVAWTLAILSKPDEPDWIKEKYTPQRMRDDKRAQGRAEKYLEAAVHAEAELLKATGKGLRNNTLHLSLCRLLPLAHGCMLGNGHGFVCRELSGAARDAGLPDREIQATIASAEKWLHASNATRLLPHAVSSPPGSIPPPAEGSPDDSPIELIQDGGSPAKCAENVARLLLEHRDWKGGPRLDLFIDRVAWPTPVPKPLESIRRRTMDVMDADESAIQGWLLSRPHNLKVRAGLDVINAGIQLAACRSAYDSLQDRVSALPPWDRVERLSSWLSSYAGARDTPVSQIFGRRWMISAIARALNPGCIADGALILEGDQGIGKNRLVTAIFGDAPWVQSIGAYRIGHNVEADRIAGSAWVVHDDEMGSRRSDVDALKAWISRREDTYRAPYERNLQTRPRRAVIVCSTNRSTYLEDDKNRRFWPIKCGVIDWARAAHDGPQLLAEALAAHRGGESWTISPSDPLWNEVEKQQDDRRVSDPIVNNIAQALKTLGDPSEITISKLADTIGVGPKDIDRALETRYGFILKEMGYYRDRVTKDGARSYVYRLVSPT